jgi:spore maturation protein CgeB
MSYRIVKVTSFYRDYLSDYYQRKPFIINESYDNQLMDIMKEGFAWADFFSKHLIKHGNEAFEIIRNAEPLQTAWARENNCKADNVLLKQLKKLKPDVLFLQDTINYSKEFIETLRKEIPSVKLIIAHVCSPHSHEQMDLFKSFDIMLVCSPGFQNYFNRNEIKNYLFYHGFEHTLLTEIQNKNDFEQNDILFIGSFFQSKTFHDSRLKLVESMLQADLPLVIYSEIKKQNYIDLKLLQMTFLSVKILRFLSMNSIIRNISPLRKATLLNEMPKRHVFSDKFISHLNNEAIFGIEMLKLLSRSKICLNNHGGIAGEYAANFRLFEVTGAGSLLLTDHKSNINDLFVPDTEIVTYRSESECISKSRWLLDNPLECQKIALAGQQKTLSSHTLEKRVGLLNDIILKELALISIKK